MEKVDKQANPVRAKAKKTSAYNQSWVESNQKSTENQEKFSIFKCWEDDDDKKMSQFLNDFSWEDQQEQERGQYFLLSLFILHS
jgi:hypothetical protein